MQVIPREQGIFVRKPEGTCVTYYIFPEYELHYNVLEPGTVQPWHHHRLIEETILMTSGQIEARWLADGKMRSQVMHAGDIARVEDTPHTFVNTSTEPATFLVVRLILTGQDKRDTIRNDKYLDMIE
ncbi:MAG TPA: cupin domain-containing protein [Ktedonobacterales bacterium]